MPSAFVAAPASEPLHFAQHASFLASALLFWWMVFARRDLSALIALFGTMLYTGTLGALMTFSRARPVDSGGARVPCRGALYRLAMARRHGCGSCHLIPGVPGANASIGPPLESLAHRVYVVGRLANTPQNPQTAMPAVGLDEALARDIAAYLYTR